MARVLKELLGNDHPLFLMSVARLEQASGNDGIDARLVGEIIEKGLGAVRKLGLDPADTTSHELYMALRSAVHHDQVAIVLASTSYVLINFGDGPISLNIRDVIENAHHELPYEQRSVAHAQRSLRREIIRRYVDHERTHPDMVYRLAHDAGLVHEHDASYDIYHVESIQTSKEHTVTKPYILSLGDIFTDAFIKLNEDVARVDTDPDGSKRISLPLGTKPPYDEVDIVRAVGPGPNAAVAFARLGLTSGLNSFVGDDQVGREALDYLTSQNVLTDTMSVQKDIKTNYYYVLRYGAERTILIKNEQFNYIWKAPAEEPDWIYLALMSEASWQYHEDLLAYLGEHPSVKLAFQPGTFHFTWGVEKLAELYKRSHIVVLNREEAVDVTGKSYDSIRELANGLHELGPQIVVITDGPSGSYASYDWKLVSIPNYPDVGPPVDRTGAGDAFASTIVAALAHGESMDTALTWAPINSANVVQQLGAQAGLLRRDEIETHLASAPDWYKLSEVQE